MDGRDLVWDHFKFNADQRLKGFNFFVLLSIFADGGVFAALGNSNLDPRLLVLLGSLIVLLAFVFWLIDTRSRQLLNLTIPALKEIAAAFPDGTMKTVRAAMEGRIGYKESGENGFGYDPIFYLPEYGCTSAELSMEEKNKISHRGKALRAIKDELR